MPLPHPLPALAAFHLACARSSHVAAAAELTALATALGDGKTPTLKATLLVTARFCRVFLCQP
jgi:hypothetical protein